MKKIFITLFGLLVLGGCATIINGSSQEIGFTYNTDNIRLKIKDKHNNTIFESTSNQNIIELERGRGYFKKQTYIIEAQKEGYLQQTYILNSRISNWYLFGNFFIGGLVGWVLVDPMTGAMYRITPETVNINLMVDNNTQTKSKLQWQD